MAHFLPPGSVPPRTSSINAPGTTFNLQPNESKTPSLRDSGYHVASARQLAGVVSIDWHASQPKSATRVSHTEQDVNTSIAVLEPSAPKIYSKTPVGSSPDEATALVQISLLGSVAKGVVEVNEGFHGWMRVILPGLPLGFPNQITTKDSRHNEVPSNTSLAEVQVSESRDNATLKPALKANSVDYLATEFAKNFERCNLGNVEPAPANPFDLKCDYSTSVPFIDLCVFDLSLPGHAVKYSSADFTLSSASVRIGHCQFLNFPTRSGLKPTSFSLEESVALRMNDDFVKPSSRVTTKTVRQTLRTEMGSDGRPRYILTFYGDLFSFGRPSRAKLGWASSIDITDPVRKFAVAEWATKADTVVENGFVVDYGDVRIRTVVGGARSTLFPVWDDWPFDSTKKSEDDESDLEPDSVDVWNDDGDLWRSVSSMKRPLENDIMEATPHITKLLHFTEVLGSLHADLLVLSPLVDGEPTIYGMSIKYISQSLRSADVDFHGLFSKMGTEDSQRLMAGLNKDRRFNVDVPWVNEAVKTVYCVPVSDGRCKSTRRKWVFFLVDSKFSSLW
jgi:hypothetical protein